MKSQKLMIKKLDTGCRRSASWNQQERQKAYKSTLKQLAIHRANTQKTKILTFSNIVTEILKKRRYRQTEP